jgi:feruloyl esterase
MVSKYLITVLALLTQVHAVYLNPNSCISLTNTKIANAKVRFATPIAAGSNFTGDSTETSYNALQTAIPAACRVACEVQTSSNSTARFEVWLPLATAWNSRFLAVGNGGWAGGVNYPDIVTGLKKGANIIS